MTEHPHSLAHHLGRQEKDGPSKRARNKMPNKLCSIYSKGCKAKSQWNKNSFLEYQINTILLMPKFFASLIEFLVFANFFRYNISIMMKDFT